MNNTREVWVVKDKEGILRPLAGIWLNENYGPIDAQRYAATNRDNDDVVLCTLTEGSLPAVTNSLFESADGTIRRIKNSIND